LTAPAETVIAPLTEAFYQMPAPDKLQPLVDWLQAYRQRLIQDYILQGTTPQERRVLMNATNPKYVLRNYLAQQAIDKASEGDFSEVENLLALLRHPYDEQPHNQHYFARRPEWARHKAGCSMLSCSS
jgi:uncharacterized protein YdiU (UPF0061 family)